MKKVVLLHGLGRSRTSLRILAWQLERSGFEPFLLDYPSKTAQIEKLVDHVEMLMPRIDDVIYFVGHSLGGILAKRLAKRLPEARRGRIVQLGAPNFGSEIAERANTFGEPMGPALVELEPNSGEDDEGLDIGAIAGTAALPAYGLITGIPGDNDGKVSVDSAWGHASIKKRIAFPVSHSLMTVDKRVIKATINFLKNGAF